MAQLAVGTLCSGLIVSLYVTDSCQQCIQTSAHTPVSCTTFSEREANGNGKVCTVKEGMMLQVPGMHELPDPSDDHQYGQREGEDCHGRLQPVAVGDLCKSSYIRAPKARESLGFYPKSYSGFGSSRSCAPPLVDDSALSPEELGSSPARIGQLSRSHGGKVDSRIGTRKRESPGRPYPREGEECKSSYIRAPKARESLGFYPKSYNLHLTDLSATTSVLAQRAIASMITVSG